MEVKLHTFLTLALEQLHGAGKGAPGTHWL